MLPDAQLLQRPESRGNDILADGLRTLGVDLPERLPHGERARLMVQLSLHEGVEQVGPDLRHRGVLIADDLGRRFHAVDMGGVNVFLIFGVRLEVLVLEGVQLTGMMGLHHRRLGIVALVLLRLLVGVRHRR